LPRITAMSAWFFNNPPVHPVGLSHDNFERSFWWFLNIQIPLRIQQNSRSKSGFYISTGNRRRIIRAWQWHNNLSSSNILILTSGHNVQSTGRVFRPVI
jgi:hypothetical protein